MNYCIVITASPLEHSTAASALAFCQALLASGHHINRIFFYRAGVMNAQPGLHSRASIADEWVALAQAHNAELCLCSASAEARGLELAEDGQSAAAYSSFTIGGLGQLVDATASADRLITFAA